MDNDPAKLQALERGDTPIHEEFLPELLERHRGERLTFTPAFWAVPMPCPRKGAALKLKKVS